jgi:16S rRNA (guanine527-N7)-methyltransferase
VSGDQDTEFRPALEAALAGFGIGPLGESQIAQLVTHFAMLCRWNQRINLTRITGVQDAARHHYAESLYGSRFIAGARTILDIGSGAGFPGIPLAVIRPDVQVTALEANQKKSLFLMEAKDAMALANFKVINARLEEYDWSGYDLLTSRALDRAETILPSVIRSLGSNQRLMLYCAPDLMAKLERKASDGIETHPIPQSESRLVAILCKR